MIRNNIIEEVKKKDLVQLKELLSEAFDADKNLENMKKLYEKNSYILGYYIDDKLVGTATLFISLLVTEKEAIIWSLAFSKEYRCLGIATKLIKYCEKLANDVIDSAYELIKEISSK